MAKILALDVGSKRIGYAVSDADETIAFPRGFFERMPHEKALAFLHEFVRDEGITKIVMGLPLGKENEDTPFATAIKKFAADVEAKLKLPIIYIDEFGSTDEALSKIPFRKDRRAKGERDAIAAQIILHRYLDRQT